jgi:hypothetical protein
MSQGVHSLVVVAEDRQIITVLEILLCSIATLTGVRFSLNETPRLALDGIYSDGHCSKGTENVLTVLAMATCPVHISIWRPVSAAREIASIILTKSVAIDPDDTGEGVLLATQSKKWAHICLSGSVEATANSSTWGPLGTNGAVWV